MGGIVMLGHWLEPLPDGTYPNLQVCTEVLQLVSLLQIDSETLSRATNLGRVVKAYAKGLAGHRELQRLAKKIVDKWSRIVFQIKTDYGFHKEDEEDKYSEFKRQHG